MTFNSEKTVHVNAYTRRDGTQVKEHYRGITSNGITGGETFAPEQKDDGWRIEENPQPNAIEKLLEKIFPVPNSTTGMSSNLGLGFAPRSWSFT